MNIYLSKIKELLSQISITDKDGSLYEYEKGLTEIAAILRTCKKAGGTLYICGNGGSAGIAQHMTADFLKNGGIRTYDMYGQSTLTCIANDLAYKYVFSKQLEMMGNEQDVLIAVSSSGESENIVSAVEAMTDLGGSVITFTGFKPQNKIRDMGKWNIYVPAPHYGMVESIHNLILQQLVDMIAEMDGTGS